MASTKISYFEKKVYIGIDVHKETYSVACICEGIIVKKASSVPANPAEFAQSIVQWFKGAEIFSAYESGFSGFNLHRELEKAGIKSIVINAASIVCRQIKPILKVLPFTRRQCKFTASTFKTRFSW